VETLVEADYGVQAESSWRRPDYTSSLDLVAIVEKAVIEKVGRFNYVEALSKAIVNDRGFTVTLPDYALADALTRCRACRAAVE
jgi:hypothetical protein